MPVGEGGFVYWGKLLSIPALKHRANTGIRRWSGLTEYDVPPIANTPGGECHVQGVIEITCDRYLPALDLTFKITHTQISEFINNFSIR